MNKAEKRRKLIGDLIALVLTALIVTFILFAIGWAACDNLFTSSESASLDYCIVWNKIGLLD